MIAAIYLIFAFTYLGLAIGKIPGLKIDRAGITTVGAAACLAIGAISLHGAAHAVDYRTIVLLFAMMIITAHLRISGFFESVTHLIAERFHKPKALLAIIILMSGILSAFLVNDVVCVALSPLVLKICEKLKRNPIPYLIALATSSNIGSVATITGNPQNIMIGNSSGIPYFQFALRLGPIAVLGLILDFLLIAWIYRSTLAQQNQAAETGPAREKNARTPHRLLLIKSVIVTIAVIVGFFLGKPIVVVALTGAAILLLERINPEKIYDLVDWPLLVMFSGLFVVVSAFESHIVQNWGIEHWHSIQDSPVFLVGVLSAAVSNLVSNVPAVLLFKPLIPHMQNQQTAWLSLAMSSTLAGNLTILGSVANLIVIETARKDGVRLGFVEYLRVGVPLTILSLLIGILWLQLT